MISYSIQKQIVKEVNIVEAVNEYVKLTKKGSTFFGLCPFHDDSKPSMSVSNNVKMYNCFSCGAKGNVISFVSKYENISIDDACIKLAKRIGLKIDSSNLEANQKETRLYSIMNEAKKFYHFYLMNTKEGSEALDYLHNRGLSNEIIERFNIGLAPNDYNQLSTYLLKRGYLELDLIELGLSKLSDNGSLFDLFRNRIMFPIDNLTNVVGFSGRIFNQTSSAKYVNSNDNVIFHKSLILYNMANAFKEARKLNRIYLFEGFMDVIAANRANVLNGVATMGTALTKDHIKSILNVTNNFVLCFDGDDAGIQAMKRSAFLLAEFNIIPDALILPDNMDPDEFIKNHGEKQLNDYLVSKPKPVYACIYELEKMKLSKHDLRSIDNFKHSVFEMLYFSRNTSVITHFLKTLAVDLGVDENTINEEFNKTSFNIQTSTNNQNSFTSIKYPNNNLINNSTNPYNLNNSNQNGYNTNSSNCKTLNFKVKPKVYKAFKVVIKHIVNKSTRCTTLFNTWSILFYEHLEKECKILNLFYELALEDRNILFENKDYNQIYNYLIKNDNSGELKTYLDDVLNSKIIDINNELEFNDCIQTINNFMIEYDIKKSMNRFITGDETQYEKYIKLNNKIKK